MKRVVRVSRSGPGSATLLGPGDPIRAGVSEADLLVPREVSWAVIQPTYLAVLDERCVAGLCAFPPLVAALFHRAVTRCQALEVQHAVTADVRVERRVLMLLWYLAERWGRVGPGFVRLDLPLTHHAIAELVNARRPTVTTAIGRLRESGAIGREGRSWLLFSRGDADDGQPGRAAPVAFEQTG